MLKPKILLLNKQAVSVMVSLAAIAIYGVVDIYFISLLGTKELAAAGIASPFMWIFNTIAGGFALAISIFTARYQSSSLSVSVIYPMFISCIMIFGIAILLYIFVIQNLLDNFSRDYEIIEYTKTYVSLWIYLFFSTLLFVAFTAVMRGLELYATQARIIIFSSLLNCFLDPILMFEPIGLGIAGAVYATTIAHMVSIVLFLCFAYKKVPAILSVQGITFQDIKFNISQIVKTAGLTIPSSAAWPLSVLISTYFVAKLGDVEVAIMGVIAKIQPLIMIPIFAIAPATTVLISKCYQDGHYDEVKENIYAAVVLMIIWQCSIAAIMLLFKDYISAFMLKQSTKGQALFSLYLTIIPATVIGRGLVYLLSQTLPALNRAKHAFFIDWFYAGLLHTSCYLIGYLTGSFSVSIYFLMLLNCTGILIFYLIIQYRTF